MFLSWDPEDRAKALAWEAEQRKVCGFCGTRGDEWDEKAGGDRFAYLPTSDQCPGCELIEKYRTTLDPDAKGVRVHLIPTELARQRAIAEARSSAWQ